MAYVGTPIDTQNQFQSLQGKRFSGDGSTTAFTLDIAPSSVFDIEVFVENVRQDPNSAYGISGTTLTFTGAPPSGTNNIYVVHQAKAVGTIDVPASGVVPASLASNILTGQTDIGAAIADADLFLLDDGAGGTLRKTAASRLKTYIGDNTPAFRAFHSSTQNVSTSTLTTLSFDSETFDSDGTYNTSNGRFTPAVAGKYVIFAHVRDDDTNSYQFEIEIRTSAENAIAKGVVVNANKDTNSIYTIADLSADEYVFVTAYHAQGGTRTFLGGTTQAYFGGFRIIGA
jgi:hypothetical protein